MRFFANYRCRVRHSTTNEKRPTSRPAFGLCLSPLLALYQRAVGRSRFPCAGIIDPGVAADNGSRPVFALEFGVVGERVMRHGCVRSEGRHLHVTDIAALPLVCLALQIFDEILFGFPVAPAVPGDEALGQMLLRPCGVVFHLRSSGLLLQLLDLVGDIAAWLGVKVEAESETHDQSSRKNNNSYCHSVMSSVCGSDCTLTGAAACDGTPT